LRLAEEAHAKTSEYSAWRSSQAKAASHSARAIMLDRARNILEVKESKRNQALQRQARMEKELAREKEKLLADLQYMRSPKICRERTC